MTLRIFCALLALLSLPATAQTPDPISGKWGEGGAPFLDLQYDGKRGITGTVTWRGGGKEATMPIRSGTFDPQRNALTIEGDGQGPDGRKGAYKIEGVVTGDVIRGKYTFADTTGDFSFDRRDALAAELASTFSFLDDTIAARLAATYGTMARGMLSGAAGLCDLGVHFGNGLYQREVEHLIRNEWAMAADDILWRRTKLGLRVSRDDRARLSSFMTGAVGDAANR